MISQFIFQSQRMAVRWSSLVISLMILGSRPLGGQTMNASISGTVTDPSGAAIPNVELTVRSETTGTEVKFTTGTDGLFRFPNLQIGTYELRASANGFREFVQRGISVNIDQTVRVDVKLVLGTAIQRVEVSANASPLNYENAEVKGAITPTTIDALPLIV